MTTTTSAKNAGEGYRFMDSETQNDAVQIRPEAGALSWDMMDENQQKAFRRIVETIYDAIGSLPEKAAAPRREKLSIDTPLGWASGDRSTKTVFLSGGRGSGKSSVLRSLIESTLIDSTSEFDEGLDRKVSDLRNRVIWLEPIDLEPLPESTNLLAAILARVEEACRRVAEPDSSRSDRDYGGLLELAQDYRGAMKRLQELQNSVALAWDGNLPQRSEHLDPEVYAVEVSRIERSRLSINRMMSTVLEEISYHVFRGKRIQNPLFVLPIDDFDLNPTSCLELLRLLRMISVPRLFNVVLGDLDVVDVALNLKVSSDLARVGTKLRHEDATSVPWSEVAAIAGEVASNAKRKLLPPSQRFKLCNFGLSNALAFKPIGVRRDSQLELREVLRREFELGKPAPQLGKDEVQGQDIQNLEGFVLIPGPVVISSPSTIVKEFADMTLEEQCSKACYSGLSAFKTTPRRLADIWSGLSHCTDNETRVRTLGELCLDTLLEDPAFLPSARTEVEGAISEKPYGGWEWRSLPVRVESIKDHAISRPAHDVSTVDDSTDTPVIRVCRGIEWRFETTSVFNAEKGGGEQNSTRPGRVLSPSSSGMLTLFHDLLALGDYRFESPFLSTIDQTERSWAKTNWGSVDLQWPVPTCASFWELDLFRAAWNHALEHQKPGSSIEQWSFAWIAAGCSMVDHERPVQLESIGTTSDQRISGAWRALVDRLEGIVNITQHPSSQSTRASEWLVGVAVLTMPEYSLPERVVQHFHGSGELNRFWRKNEPSRAIRRLRGHALARLMSAGHDTLAYRLRDKPKEAVGHLLIPRFDYVFALAERLKSEEQTEFLNLPDEARVKESRGPKPTNYFGPWGIIAKDTVVDLLAKSHGSKKPVMAELGFSNNYTLFNTMLAYFDLDADDFKRNK